MDNGQPASCRGEDSLGQYTLSRMSAFVHLHVHSEYSPLDGLARCDQLAQAASALGQSALAITDHGSLHGVVAFDRACRSAGVRPIIGCEVYTSVGRRVDDDRAAKERSTHHLTVLADGDDGYRSLLGLVSGAWLSGFYGKPRVDLDALDRHRKGLVVLSGCLGGEVARLISGDIEATSVALAYREIFGDAYYLEAMDTGLPEQRKVCTGLRWLSRRTGIPVVATGDVHYVHEADWRLHDVLMSVQMQRRVGDRPDDGARYHLRSQEEMLASLPESWVWRAGEVADRCRSPMVTSGRLSWPVASGASLDDAAGAGMAWRYGEGWKSRSDLVARLQHELRTIRATGYIEYIRIVADLCRHARARGIRTAARGSAAGSMVLYALGITDVDPIASRLSFERFLNEGRSPDIDLDFEDERRGEIIEYLASTYGADRVAGICTFARMGGRTSIRDVGRAYGVPANRTARIAEEFGSHEGADDAWERVMADHPAEGWLAHAQRLEGTLRHVGRHAAGVVIGSSPLDQVVPLVRDSDGKPLCGLEMSDVEACGLVKFDILGLRTLSTLSACVAMSGDDIDAIADGDDATYRLLGEGRTLGVFQLESAGMRRLMARLQPRSIAQLSAMLALYRPGPIRHIDEYIDRATGRSPARFVHDAFRPILEDTYGVVVYQEAILEAARDVAGLSPADADKLLSIVRKKRAELLPEWRGRFVAGCAGNGVPRDKALEFWEAVEPFAGYGFNKAHASAYARLTYQTAWLKANRPGAFLAASLRTEDDSGKVASLVMDARRMGVRTLPPCVQSGGAGVTLIGDRMVRLGLSSVKGLGPAGVDAIIEARGILPFASPADFRARVSRRAVNARALSSLIDAGALHSLCDRDRARELLGCPASTSGVEDLRREASALGMVVSVDVSDSVPWEALGRTLRSGAVASTHGGARATVGGMIVALEQRRSPKGPESAWVRIDDTTGEAWVCLPGDCASWKTRAVVGSPIVATGRVYGSPGDRFMMAQSAVAPWSSLDAQVLYDATASKGGL